MMLVEGCWGHAYKPRTMVGVGVGASGFGVLGLNASLTTKVTWRR